MSRIFEACWTDRKSLCIGHVCRRWRSVLLGTTQFWTDAVGHEQFTSNRSAEYLVAILERSAPRNVALSCASFSEGFSRCIASHAARTTSLKVTVADGSQLAALWDCLSSGMPELSSAPGMARSPLRLGEGSETIKRPKT